jgi:site-specific DNA-methyltransferase (adenine-specific)
MKSKRSQENTIAAEWVDVTTLRPWERNPRINRSAIEPVARSIARFGFAAPIVARVADREVIAGHTRLLAMAFLRDRVLDDTGEWRDRRPEDGAFIAKGSPGPGQVPVRWMDLPASEARALALADNRLGELADWDTEGLAATLRELAGDDTSLDGLGWSTDDLKCLLDEPAAPPPAGPSASPPRPMPGTARVLVGRCEDRMREIPDASIHACVCDPPYGLSKAPDPREVLACWMAGRPYIHTGPGFMGKEWDSFIPGPEVWREVYRCLKPGGHVVAFAGTRTVDWLMLALRLAGFECRDKGEWSYHNGFPKSSDISRLLVEKAGESRPDRVLRSGGYGRTGPSTGGAEAWTDDPGTPITDAAKRWNGWGTAIKPAVEPWVLARKPLEGTVADNILKHGVGGLNIDACRFAPGDPMWLGPSEGDGGRGGTNGFESTHGASLHGGLGSGDPRPRAGRFPANLIHCPKPGRKEREAGCDHLPLRVSPAVEHAGEGAKGLASPRAGVGRGIRSWGADTGGHLSASGLRNTHPTLKPIRLMAWLARLVTPPGGVVLDPFAGSGTVGCAAVPQGFEYIGIEIDPDYCKIAEARIAYWSALGLSAIPEPEAIDPDNEDPEDHASDDPE